MCCVLSYLGHGCAEPAVSSSSRRLHAALSPPNGDCQPLYHSLLVTQSQPPGPVHGHLLTAKETSPHGCHTRGPHPSHRQRHSGRLTLPPVNNSQGDSAGTHTPGGDSWENNQGLGATVLWGHTHTHTLSHMHSHSRTSYTPTYRYMYTHPYTHTCIHTPTPSHLHTYSCTRTDAHTHASSIHTFTHSYVHTYIHTLPRSLSLSSPPIPLSPLLCLHSPSLPVPSSELHERAHACTHARTQCHGGWHAPSP